MVESIPQPDEKLQSKGRAMTQEKTERHAMFASAILLVLFVDSHFCCLDCAASPVQQRGSQRDVPGEMRDVPRFKMEVPEVGKSITFGPSPTGVQKLPDLRNSLQIISISEGKAECLPSRIRSARINSLPVGADSPLLKKKKSGLVYAALLQRAIRVVLQKRALSRRYV